MGVRTIWLLLQIYSRFLDTEYKGKVKGTGGGIFLEGKVDNELEDYIIHSTLTMSQDYQLICDLLLRLLNFQVRLLSLFKTRHTLQMP